MVIIESISVQPGMSVIYSIICMIRVGDHQVPTSTPLTTKGPIAFAGKCCGSLFPVTELGLSGLCYYSDFQVQYLT